MLGLLFLFGASKIVVLGFLGPRGAIRRRTEPALDSQGSDTSYVEQLTLNRIRDCAVTNKEELFRILYSTEHFTRSGKRRVRELITQLISSNPVASPTTSTLLDGSWERQGTISRRLQVVDLNAEDSSRKPSLVTFAWWLGGAALVTREWNPQVCCQVVRARARRCHDLSRMCLQVADTRRYELEQLSSWISVGGLEVQLPTRNRTVQTEVLYLDSDLFISRRFEGERPEIYTKISDESAVLGGNSSETGRSGWSSPFRVRQRTAAVLRNVFEGWRDKRPNDNRPSGGGMIGDLDWRSEGPAPWQTEDDILEQLREQASNVNSKFSVQDLLEGRVRMGEGKKN